ncbi:chaperone DnaJ-domain superfamily protein [Actinidia rufa]|uniref:Chaperone DnaJ-domain superfamily protein n=1 Tax=Actinidia rufa TaxID=165716 RepID=A0A7J0F4G8_9ERIC|nr:chaperone DnaJ-domain superfamily protein [Actinidia rufa]
MKAYLLVGPASVDGCGRITRRSPLFVVGGGSFSPHRRRLAPVMASAPVNGKQNHYGRPWRFALRLRRRYQEGLSSSRSQVLSFVFYSITKFLHVSQRSALLMEPSVIVLNTSVAFHILTLHEYHPDVSKDPRADEVFKNIRLAYDILSNETSRNQYDRSLKFQEDTSGPFRGNRDFNQEFDDEIRIYRWSDLRQRMRHERYWKQYKAREENSSSYDEADEAFEEGTTDEERGPFVEVLRSAFLSLFLMQTIGSRLSLTGGILLTMCLSFASWACGKTSSSAVALVVVAMWVGSNLARYAPVPQGALLTLLYMSFKLQTDLN